MTFRALSGLIVALLVLGGCSTRTSGLANSFTLRQGEVACELHYGNLPEYLFGPLTSGESETMTGDGTYDFEAQVAMTDEALIIRIDQRVSEQMITVALADFEGDTVQWNGNWVYRTHPNYSMICWG